MFFCVSQRATTTNRLEVFSHTQSREIQLRQERKNLTRKWRCDFLFCLYTIPHFYLTNGKLRLRLAQCTTLLLFLLISLYSWWYNSFDGDSDEPAVSDDYGTPGFSAQRRPAMSVPTPISFSVVVVESLAPICIVYIRRSLFSLRFCFLFPGFVCVCVYTSVPHVCVESSGREPQSHLIRVSFLSLAEFRIRWRLLLDYILRCIFHSFVIRQSTVCL